MNKSCVSRDNQRIMSIFGVDCEQQIPALTQESLSVYFDHLHNNLKFPAKGYLEMESGPMRIENHSLIAEKIINNDDDFYGLFIEGKADRKAAVVPLADFSCEDRTHANFQLIDDYKSWFWNYR